jgi:hypothetical protein
LFLLSSQVAGELFLEFPPRQKAASFTIDQVVESLIPRT